LNKQAEVTSVRNQSTGLLEVLKHKNIQIGTRLEVKSRFYFDNSLEVKVKDFTPITISEQLAKVLFVKMIPSKSRSRETF
jgi:DtxR family Mn-dependent transcriptional regulator